MTYSSLYPKVAIIITAYNAQRYILACIRAALSQVYPAFEVVVVDDGSNDDTKRLCLSMQDARLRYLNKGHIGRQRALNEGIAHTDAEYIAINDADDLSLPHRLRYTMEFFRDHEHTALVGTAFSATAVFLDSVPDSFLTTAESEHHTHIMWPSRATMFRRNLFTHSTVMFPKRIWELIGGYDESLTLSEDYDFYLRAMQHGPAALLPSRTVLWFTNPSGIFKQRPNRDNLQTLRLIKARAHRLLGLPAWLSWYQPLWEVAFHVTSRCPFMLDVTCRIRQWATTRSDARSSKLSKSVNGLMAGQ
jgi:glycosyltransferase involved in cell wall biosynthesis